MALLTTIGIDCVDVHCQMRFWATVFEYRYEPPDEAFLDRLRAAGAPEEDLDDRGALRAPPGVLGPILWFQRVPEPPSTKNRIHVDVLVDDLDAKVAELVGLGGELVPQGPPTPMDLAVRQLFPPAGELRVMRDPEGNWFCLHARG